MPFLIEDAKSYFTAIKSNRLNTEAEDEEAIEILKDQLGERIKAANLDNRTGPNRDAFMFFQGAIMGNLIEAKKYRQHLKTVASEQNISLDEDKEDAISH